jgi:hypothetical protein
VTRAPRSPKRRFLRLALLAAGGLVVLCLLLVLLFLLPPVRTRLLEEGLSRAESALPGTLAAREASWPAPGRVEIRDLLWSDGPDTLAFLERLSVSVSLGDLFRRDVRLSDLRVEGLVVAPDGIRGRLEKGSEGGEEPASGGGAPFFPRAGSLAGAPSVAVDRFDLEARVRGDGGLRRIEVSGGLSLLRSQSPFLRIDRLSAAGPEEGWRVEEADLQVDLARGRLAGEGRGRLLPGFAFHYLLEPEARDAFRMRLAAGPPREEETPWLDLRGTLQREDLRVEEVRLEGSLRTPGSAELARMLAGSEAAGSWPALEGVTANLEGELRPGDAPEGRLSVQVERNDWLEGAGMRLGLGEAGLSLDTLFVNLPDLEIGASAALAGDSLRGELVARARGAGWLAVLRPEAEPPESLTLDLDARAEGPRSSPRIWARLEGSMRSGGFDLDRLLARVSRPADADSPVEVALEARAFERILQVDARASLGNPLEVSVAPLRLLSVGNGSASSGAPRSPTPPDGWGAVRRDAAAGALEIENLSVVGDLGTLALDGTLHPDEGGPFRIVWMASEPPPLLLRALGGDPPVVDSLESAWRRDGPFRLEVSGRLGDPRSNPPEVRAKGRLALPGPATLAALLPPGSRVGDLDTIRGVLEIRAGRAAGVADFSAEVDLSPTSWIDTARVALGGRGGVLGLDTLTVVLPGIRISAGGETGPGLLDLAGRLEVRSPGLPDRFLPAGADSVDARLAVTARAGGSPERPEVTARIQARGRGRSFVLPDLEGELTWSPAKRELRLRAADGLRTGPLSFTGATALYEGDPEAPAPFPAHLVATLSGDTLSLHADARVEAEGGLWITADSLAVRVLDRDLRSRGPFRLRIGPGDAGLSIRDLALEGSLGAVTASGRAGPDSSSLEARASLRLPEPPPAISIPAGLWPRGVDLQIRAEGRDRIAATLAATGLVLDDREGVRARLRLESGGGRAEVRLVLADTLGAMVDGRLRFPARLAFYPPRLDSLPGTAEGDIRIRGLPLPSLLPGERERGRAPRLDGEARIRGPLAAPSLQAELAATAPRIEKVSEFRAETNLFIVPPRGLDPQLRDPADPTGRAAGEEAQPGLHLELDLLRGSETLMEGRIRYPLSWSLLPPSAAPRAEETVVVEVHSADVPLDRFDFFLPENIGLAGTLRLDLSTRGPLNDPDLDGRVVAHDLQVSLADGSRVHADADIGLAGRRSHPVVEGSIEVGQGVLRIPETQEELLPDEGSPVLWTLEGMGPDGGPGEESSEEGTTGQRAGASAEPSSMDLDVGLVIPSGLWIRGRGLEVELAGDLRFAQRGGIPTVTGSLEAVRGHLVFLGRNFQVERGQVTFYGEDEIDPTLDIQLTNRTEGVLVRVSFGGTVREPELTLSSEPEMSEGDIFSLLLFGRSIDELNSDQVDLLQRRATDLVASYGAAKLETGIARRLGVDMLTVRRAEGEKRRSSLVIGKYLSRRVLLRYEQVLEEQINFLINLEYFLSRHFRLETVFGRESQSGLGIKWITDY